MNGWKNTPTRRGLGWARAAERLRSRLPIAAADAAMAAMNGAMIGGRQIRIEKTSEDGR